MFGDKVPVIGVMQYERVGVGLREIPPTWCVRPERPHDLRGGPGKMLITWNPGHQLRGYVCLACDEESPEYAEWCVGEGQIPLLPGEQDYNLLRRNRADNEPRTLYRDEKRA